MASGGVNNGTLQATDDRGTGRSTIIISITIFCSCFCSAFFFQFIWRDSSSLWDQNHCHGHLLIHYTQALHETMYGVAQQSATSQQSASAFVRAHSSKSNTIDQIDIYRLWMLGTRYVGVEGFVWQPPVAIQRKFTVWVAAGGRQLKQRAYWSEMQIFKHF